MSVLWTLVLLSAAAGLAASQDCDYPSRYFSGLFAPGQNGSSLTPCAFSGQQCCDPSTISFFKLGIRFAIDSFAPMLVSGFATAQDAIDELRNANKVLIPYIAEDIMRPLLLSAVSPLSSTFTSAVDDAVTEIADSLNGSDVNLTVTFHGYINAVVFNLLSIDETSINDGCINQAIFNHVYSKTDSVAELSELLQNISTVIKILKQLPPLFKKLLGNFNQVDFTDTCSDIFLSNYLCPLCRNQPFMCPGRCEEIIIGCVSPFNQAFVQLDTSFRLIMSIVKSLNGSSDSVTNSVNINHIPTLYGSLIESIEISELIEKIASSCNATAQPSSQPGRRSLNEQSVMDHKRATSTPNVGLNSSLFDELENKFILLDRDITSSAKETLCDPTFNMTIIHYTFKTTIANGMCSFGLGNVGSYNSTFTEEDIAYQAFNNPAGQYNYTQLVEEAEMQTYIITELFNGSDISPSMFNIFLPDETIPTTDFLIAPAPDGPIITVPTPTVTISPSGPIQGAMVGSPQVINCTVSTVSGVESSSVMISWMGPGGNSLLNDSRVTISPTTSISNTYTSNLQFTYLMEGDEGTYTCNVMVLETSGSQSVELQSLIVPDPVVRVTVTSLQTVGQSLTLYCNGTTVRGITSDVDIVWRRDDTIVNNVTHVTPTTTMDNLLVYEDLYTISQLNISDNNAVYECRMVVRTYLQTVATDTIILDVTALPQIYLHPLDKSVKVDNDSTSVTFICMAYYASSYYWLRETGDIPSNAMGVNSNTLTLHNILPPDSGRYQCVAENEHESTHSNYAILIVEALPPVVSIVSDKELKVKEGERVKMHCSADGVGAENFVYQWFLNDLSFASDTSTFVIGAVSEDNTGDYQCFVRNQYNGIGQSEVVKLVLDQYCDAVTVNYSGFNITWNATLVGITVEAHCTGYGLNGTIRRRCIGSDQWEEYFECFREETRMLLDQASNLTSSVNELSETEIVAITNDIAHALVNVTTTAEEPIFAQDIDLAVNIISTLNNVTETVVASLTVNDTFFEDTVVVIDNLLADINQDNWKQLERTSPSTSQALVSGTEQFTKILSETLSNDATEVIKTKPNIVVKAERVSNDSVNKDYVFPDEDDNLTSYTGGSAQLTISSGLLQNITAGSNEVTIASVVIRNGSSLRLPSSNNGTAVPQLPASPIFSLQIIPLPDLSILLENPIMMMFDVDPTAVLSGAQNVQDFTVDDASCSFYDYTLVTDNNLNQFGGWSTEGLTVDKIHSNKTSVTCLTRHLTSFAVLVSIQDENPTRPSMADKALSIISYIGCSISLVCLCVSIILLSFIIYKTKENKTHLFIHLNLCIALALGLVVFIAGIENATNNEDTCKFVAALLQYLFTSAFCWMLCEGVFLYMMLVTVFGNKLNHKCFFFVLGWGPAIPIVMISTGIAHKHYGTDHYCWIGSDDGAIAAFIAPIVTITLINCIFLAITLKVLWQQKSLSKQAASNNDTVKGILKATIILLPLLGMTWIIGILAVNNETQVFAWIFTILNSLQGVFIFVLHVIRNKQIAREIRERYNFIRRSATLRRLLSIRGSGSLSRLGVSSKSKTSKGIYGEVIDENKKISSTFGSGITDGDFLNKELLKATSEVFEDSGNDQIKLTTLNKLEESIIPEHDIGVENKESITEDHEEEKKSITEEDGAAIVENSSNAAATIEE